MIDSKSLIHESASIANNVKIGAYAVIEKNWLTITGYIASIDGTKFIKNKVSGKKDAYEKLARDLSDVFIKMGSKRMLKC